MMGVRQKMNETNKQTQIVLAAIEKHPDMDIEELIKKISPKEKLLKEKLLNKLLWGSLVTFLGIAFFGVAFYIDWMGGMMPGILYTLYLGGFILFAVGLAFLINYRIGRKMLAKEIEAEERKIVEN
jgi:hypothetical protein